MSITGFWLNKERVAVIDGKRVSLIAAFALTENPEKLTSGERAEELVPIPGSTVVLYKPDTDAPIHMFRWDNGVDISLEINDVSEAKNAVETMLKMEGISYVK